jgi:hypothetical protein
MGGSLLAMHHTRVFSLCVCVCAPIHVQVRWRTMHVMGACQLERVRLRALTSPPTNVALAVTRRGLGEQIICVCVCVYFLLVRPAYSSSLD